MPRKRAGSLSQFALGLREEEAPRNTGAKYAEHDERRNAGSKWAEGLESSKIPVIRNPESTKNRFTPTQPGRVAATNSFGNPDRP
jgi:hypothetical protein